MEKLLYIASLAGLYLFWYLAIRSYKLDKFRSDLFDLRSDLFDLADTGKIPFESDLYTSLNKRINLFIRYAHHLNFTTIFALNHLSDKGYIASNGSKYVMDIVSEARAAFGFELDEEVLLRLNTIEKESYFLTMKYLIGQNFLALSIYAALNLLYKFKLLRTGFVNSIQSSTQKAIVKELTVADEYSLIQKEEELIAVV